MTRRAVWVRELIVARIEARGPTFVIRTDIQSVIQDVSLRGKIVRGNDLKRLRPRPFVFALRAIMSYHLPYLSDPTSLTSLLRHHFKA
jgi:hypothetical protein